ncbi:WD repeat-containing protein 88-like [Ruditapes philippinarum]|uniref:WD repeat-containing protein 88-like n=1 Tax=Ruditapes philippinarum TaxID=129788 RepID=UPI00295B7741|nr:WD repeat-containing protein 88-like [Ruditapes philippinarum]
MTDAIATEDDIKSDIDLVQKATWEHEELAQVRIKVIKAHNAAVNSCEFFDDDEKILTGSSDRTVKLFNTEDGVCLKTYNTKHTDIITEARGCTEGSKFVTSSYDKSIQMFDIETGKNLWSGNHNGMVMSCKISSDGSMVASGSDLDNCLKIWDSHTGQVIHSITDLHKSTITSVMFAPDNDKVITTSMDRTTKFFDLKTRKSTIHLQGHINIVSSCDITKDERKFASASWDKNICIWDIATGTYRSKGPAKLCAGHEGSVSCCKFSNDGLMLVSGSYDQTVVVWDIENEIQKIKLQGHTDWVEDVCFSQDQSWLMSCARDCTVRLWNIEDSDKIPIVLEKKRAIGVKITKCENCGKPFSMAQLDDAGDLTRCVFCRVHTSDLYFEKMRTESTNPEVTEPTDPES